MKHFKKAFSLLLALLMIAVLTVPSSAETGYFTDSTKGTITINNAVVGVTYAVYRIFDLQSFDTVKNAYSYTVNTQWAEFISQMTAYVIVDTNGFVTWVKGTTQAEKDAAAAEFAAKAIVYAKENKIAAEKTILALTTSIIFTELPLGYYLVDSTLGILCSLTTTSKNAIINEKNEAPTVEKQVCEDSTGMFGKTNDVALDEIITFKATIHVKNGAENYVLHDVMTNMTFVGITAVTLNGTVVPEVGNYGFQIPADGCTFELAFTPAFCNSLKNDDTIEVLYTAKLTQNAVIGGNGNPNDLWLTYGDNNKTEPARTITYTWELPIFKYYLSTDNGIETPLAGAGFTLYYAPNVSAGGNIVEPTAVRLHLNSTVGHTDNHWMVCSDPTCNKPHVTEVFTDENGYVYIDGLDSNSNARGVDSLIYSLKETTTPPGFNKLDKVLTVTIDKVRDLNGDITNYIVKVDNTDTTANLITVLNQTGPKLPETGGMGTTIFYVTGGLMVVGAVVFLVAKRRMRAGGDAD